MSCLASSCELVHAPIKPVLLRDLGRDGMAVSVRVAVSLLAPDAARSTDTMDPERLMEDPERWDGLA